MILTVGNIKGGVGKTVLAVNIAVALAQRGVDVLLIDGDEQASAAMFAQVRAEAGAKAEFTTIQLQGAAIRQQARQLRDKYDEIVIDVGGRDTGSLRAALTITDMVLIPFQPRSVDLWAASQIAALVAEAREVNGPLEAYSLINIADPVGKDNEDAAEVLAGLDFIKALPLTVVRRKAFPNAFSSGLSVGELVPRDQKAADELLSLVSALYTQRADNDYQNSPHRKAAV
jgi:chromosome partitioning protein